MSEPSEQEQLENEIFQDITDPPMRAPAIEPDSIVPQTCAECHHSAKHVVDEVCRHPVHVCGDGYCETGICGCKCVFPARADENVEAGRNATPDNAAESAFEQTLTAWESKPKREQNMLSVRRFFFHSGFDAALTNQGDRGTAPTEHKWANRVGQHNDDPIWKEVRENVEASRAGEGEAIDRGAARIAIDSLKVKIGSSGSRGYLERVTFNDALEQALLAIEGLTNQRTD